MAVWIAGAMVVMASTAVYGAYSSYEAGKEAEDQQKKAEEIGALYGENADYAKQLERRRTTLLQPTLSAGLSLGEQMGQDADGTRLQGELNTSMAPRIGLANQAEKTQVINTGARVGGARDVSATRTITNMYAGTKAGQSAGLAAATKSDNQNRKIATVKAGQQLSQL